MGWFVGLGHPDVTEVISRMDIDWMLINGEQAPIGLETTQMMLQAMSERLHVRARYVCVQKIFIWMRSPYEVNLYGL